MIYYRGRTRRGVELQHHKSEFKFRRYKINKSGKCTKYLVQNNQKLPLIVCQEG